MPDLHPSNRRWMVHYRDRDGKVRGSHNMTAHVGTETYERRMAVIRGTIPDGWTLDSTEADAEHTALVQARERFDDALAGWLLSSVGVGPVRDHPGNPSDWRPDR